MLNVTGGPSIVRAALDTPAVALVLRGESFRHFQSLPGLATLPGVVRRRLLCTNASWTMQQALAATTSS